MNPTALESIYILQRYLGSDWLLTFLKMDVQDIKDMTDEVNAVAVTPSPTEEVNGIGAPSFIKENPADDAVKRIMEYLDNGINVVLEFDDIRTICLHICWLPIYLPEGYMRGMSRGVSGRRTRRDEQPLVIKL